MITAVIVKLYALRKAHVWDIKLVWTTQGVFYMPRTSHHGTEITSQTASLPIQEIKVKQLVIV